MGRSGLRLRRRPLVLLALAAAPAAAGLYLAGCAAGEQAAPSQKAPAAGNRAVAPGGSAPASAAALQNALVDALKVAAPSVVEISSANGLGSGVIFDKAGDVVTNAHVVGSSASFTVLLADGRRSTARLVGVFVPDDLAVIKLATTAGVKAATFANSATLKPGDLTLAIGSPYGLAGSVTDGIVSSTGRTVSESDSIALPDLIQTSAAINPGNSGGALVDLSGRVIGIPTLAATSGESGAQASGIGFAIPSNTVRLIAPQLITKGTVTSAGRAALGISVSPATDAFGDPVGVYVAAVRAGGAASKAGIVVGDVIVNVAGHDTPDVSSLTTVLAELKPGARTKVTVVTASGGRRTVTAVLDDLGRQ